LIRLSRLAALARDAACHRFGGPIEEVHAMAFDPFAEEQVRPRLFAHDIGQDLSMLSIHEIDERIALLQQEIERLKVARSRKEDSRAAASAFFKTA
jgi:uncharacterized small protein (DUF1192 family)